MTREEIAEIERIAALSDEDLNAAIAKAIGHKGEPCPLYSTDTAASESLLDYAEKQQWGIDEEYDPNVVDRYSHKTTFTIDPDWENPGVSFTASAATRYRARAEALLRISLPDEDEESDSL